MLKLLKHSICFLYFLLQYIDRCLTERPKLHLYIKLQNLREYFRAIHWFELVIDVFHYISSSPFSIVLCKALGYQSTILEGQHSHLQR